MILGHILDMDWTQIVITFVGMTGILGPAIWWVVRCVHALDGRITVLETRHETDSQKLDRISTKVTDIQDSIRVIRVAIAKIETLMGARSSDTGG